jgi:hypothetical protein
MSKLAFIVALFACSAGAEELGEKGQIVPLGNVSFTHSSNENSLRIAPGALWFPRDRLALGLFVVTDYASLSLPPGAIGTTSVAQFGLQPTAGAAAPLAERWSLFPRVGLGFSVVRTESTGFPGGTSTRVVGVASLFVPVVFAPVPHIFLGAGPFFDVFFGSSTDTAYGVTSTIGGWF